MSLFSAIFGKETTTDFKSLVREGAVIIDVRSPEEYAGGHIQNSINIPLNEIRQHARNLKSKNKLVITCCRSGNRSGMAKDILAAEGINALNGGAWNSLNRQLQ